VNRFNEPSGDKALAVYSLHQMVPVNLIFRDITISYRVCTSLFVDGHGIHKVDRIVLPDSAYGEYIFYEKYVPRFHISIFNSNGEMNELGRAIQSSAKEAEETLISIFAANGHRQISCLKSGIFFPYSKSLVREMRMLTNTQADPGV
jgi:hypothetical protein